MMPDNDDNVKQQSAQSRDAAEASWTHLLPDQFYTEIGRGGIREGELSAHSQAPDKMNGIPFFSVTGNVTFQSVEGASRPDSAHLPAKMARMVSALSLGAVLLLPLSSCANEQPPCKVPQTATNYNENQPLKCTTSGGSRYVWIPSRGGWVSSSDGIHPNKGARGVGSGGFWEGGSGG